MRAFKLSGSCLPPSEAAPVTSLSTSAGDGGAKAIPPTAAAEEASTHKPLLPAAANAPPATPSAPAPAPAPASTRAPLVAARSPDRQRPASPSRPQGGAQNTRKGACPSAVPPVQLPRVAAAVGAAGESERGAHPPARPPPAAQPTFPAGRLSQRPAPAPSPAQSPAPHRPTATQQQHHHPSTKSLLVRLTEKPDRTSNASSAASGNAPAMKSGATTTATTSEKSAPALGNATALARHDHAGAHPTTTGAPAPAPAPPRRKASPPPPVPKRPPATPTLASPPPSTTNTAIPPPLPSTPSAPSAPKNTPPQNSQSTRGTKQATDRAANSRGRGTKASSSGRSRSPSQPRAATSVQKPSAPDAPPLPSDAPGAQPPSQRHAQPSNPSQSTKTPPATAQKSSVVATPSSTRRAGSRPLSPKASSASRSLSISEHVARVASRTKASSPPLSVATSRVSTHSPPRGEDTLTASDVQKLTPMLGPAVMTVFTAVTGALDKQTESQPAAYGVASTTGTSSSVSAAARATAVAAAAASGGAPAVPKASTASSGQASAAVTSGHSVETQRRSSCTITSTGGSENRVRSFSPAKYESSHDVASAWLSVPVASPWWPPPRGVGMPLPTRGPDDADSGWAPRLMRASGAESPPPVHSSPFQSALPKLIQQPLGDAGNSAKSGGSSSAGFNASAGSSRPAVSGTGGGEAPADALLVRLMPHRRNLLATAGGSIFCEVRALVRRSLPRQQSRLTTDRGRLGASGAQAGSLCTARPSSARLRLSTLRGHPSPLEARLRNALRPARRVRRLREMRLRRERRRRRRMRLQCVSLGATLDDGPPPALPPPPPPPPPLSGPDGQGGPGGAGGAGSGPASGGGADRGRRSRSLSARLARVAAEAAAARLRLAAGSEGLAALRGAAEGVVGDSTESEGVLRCLKECREALVAIVSDIDTLAEDVRKTCPPTPPSMSSLTAVASAAARCSRSITPSDTDTFTSDAEEGPALASATRPAKSSGSSASSVRRVATRGSRSRHRISTKAKTTLAPDVREGSAKKRGCHSGARRLALRCIIPRITIKHSHRGSRRSSVAKRRKERQEDFHDESPPVLPCALSPSSQVTPQSEATPASSPPDPSRVPPSPSVTHEVNSSPSPKRASNVPLNVSQSAMQCQSIHDSEDDGSLTVTSASSTATGLSRSFVAGARGSTGSSGGDKGGRGNNHVQHRPCSPDAGAKRARRSPQPPDKVVASAAVGGAGETEDLVPASARPRTSKPRNSPGPVQDAEPLSAVSAFYAPDAEWNDGGAALLNMLSSAVFADSLGAGQFPTPVYTALPAIPTPITNNSSSATTNNTTTESSSSEGEENGGGRASDGSSGGDSGGGGGGTDAVTRKANMVAQESSRLPPYLRNLRPTPHGQDPYANSGEDDDLGDDDVDDVDAAEAAAAAAADQAFAAAMGVAADHDNTRSSDTQGPPGHLRLLRASDGQVVVRLSEDASICRLVISTAHLVEGRGGDRGLWAGADIALSTSEKGMELRLPLGCAHEPQVAQRFVRLRLRDEHTLALAVEPATPSPAATPVSEAVVAVAPANTPADSPAADTEAPSPLPEKPTPESEPMSAAGDAVVPEAATVEGSKVSESALTVSAPAESSVAESSPPTPLVAMTPDSSDDASEGIASPRTQTQTPVSTDEASVVTVIPARAQAATVHYAQLVQLPRPIFQMAVMECRVQPSAVVKKRFFAPRALPRPDDAASDESEWEDAQDEEEEEETALSAITRRQERAEAAAASAAFIRSPPHRPFSLTCTVGALAAAAAPESPPLEAASGASGSTKGASPSAASSSTSSSSLSREPSVITLALSMPAASPRDLAHDWVMGPSSTSEAGAGSATVAAVAAVAAAAAAVSAAAAASGVTPAAAAAGGAGDHARSLRTRLRPTTSLTSGGESTPPTNTPMPGGASLSTRTSSLAVMVSASVADTATLRSDDSLADVPSLQDETTACAGAQTGASSLASVPSTATGANRSPPPSATPTVGAPASPAPHPLLVQASPPPMRAWPFPGNATTPSPRPSQTTRPVSAPGYSSGFMPPYALAYTSSYPMSGITLPPPDVPSPDTASSLTLPSLQVADLCAVSLTYGTEQELKFNVEAGSEASYYLDPANVETKQSQNASEDLGTEVAPSFLELTLAPTASPLAIETTRHQVLVAAGGGGLAMEEDMQEYHSGENVDVDECAAAAMSMAIGVSASTSDPLPTPSSMGIFPCAVMVVASIAASTLYAFLRP